MRSEPTLIAYVVTDPREGGDRKVNWHEVGPLSRATKSGH
jgi:hypothetical protein